MTSLNAGCLLASGRIHQRDGELPVALEPRPGRAEARATDTAKAETLIYSTIFNRIDHLKSVVNLRLLMGI